MEVYFSVHGVTRKKNILFTHLNLEGHDLTWWEIDTIRRALGNEPPMNEP
jgi:hypothetical protein